MFQKLINRIRQFLLATVFGTMRLAWAAVKGAVKAGYYTVITSVRLAYMTVVGTLRLAKATVVGTFRLAKATVIGTMKLAIATLRRFRFNYVILLNMHRAPYLTLKLKYWAEHPERYSETQRFLLAKRVIFYLSRTGHIRTIATGRKNLPKEGGYAMFPNHQGKYDALGIMRVHPSPCTVVMDEKKSHTVLTSQFLDAIGGKRLEIDNPRQTVKLFNEIAEEIRQGKRYIIFPEGGYENGNGNELGEFKPGSFKAAIKAKAPIIPVALVDSYRAFNSALLGPVMTYVHYLKPIYYDEYRTMRTPEIAALVRSRIEERIRIASQKEVKKMLRRAQEA